MKSSNMQRLGNVLAGRMKATAGAATKVAMELGTINSNLSLSTDSLQASIPPGSYMVNRTLIDEIQSGDRVLVAWCGNEPVVIAVVVSS